MSRPTRRSLLRSGGFVITGALAGCMGRLTGTRESPDRWPSRSTDEPAPVRWRLEHDEGPSFVPARTGDGIVVAWGHYFGHFDGSISKVTGTAGTVEWHRNVPLPPYRPPVVHGGDPYLLTGVNSGHVRDRQRLRRFGPDGTQQWRTEPRSGLLNLLAMGEDRAFLGTERRVRPDDPRAASQYAVSLADGQREWTRGTPSNEAGAYRDGRLLVQFGDESIASVDPAAGTDRWRTGGRWLTDGDDGPAFRDGVGYVRRNDGVAAVDVRDGSTVWETTLADAGRRAVVTESEVVADLHSGLVALDPADGTERWRIETAGSPIRPVAGEGSVFVTDDDSLHAIDPATGQRRWRTDSQLWVGDVGRGMVATVGGPRGSRELVALDARDGTERWRYETAEVGGITVGEWHTYASLGEEGLVALGT